MDTQPISQFGMWERERETMLAEAVPALFLITAQVTPPHLTPELTSDPEDTESQNSQAGGTPGDWDSAFLSHYWGNGGPGGVVTCPGTWSRQGAESGSQPRTFPQGPGTPPCFLTLGACMPSIPQLEYKFHGGWAVAALGC